MILKTSYLKPTNGNTLFAPILPNCSLAQFFIYANAAVRRVTEPFI